MKMAKTGNGLFRPIHVQCNRNAHGLFVCNCVAIVETRKLVAMVARSGHGLLLTYGVCTCT